ncbi:MAG: antibiotic biosynthesis monooxygenase [Roseburia sp.]|nr:antibiotic biosynthesis monooxygenase [Roseburia sp.]
MGKSFTEMITFQVKPDKVAEFETLVEALKAEQEEQHGCIGIRYFKRFYTFDGIEHGNPPREITKIVKCVKYYAYWEFDTIENCGKANGWFFDNY